MDARLWMPPKGVAPVAGPWTAEAESAAFDNLLNQLGGQKADTPVTQKAEPLPANGARSARAIQADRTTRR